MLIHEFLESIIPYITGSLEAIGVFIIVIGAIRSIFRFVKNHLSFRKEDVAIDFAKSMSLGLEFKLAAEIIMTVVIRTMDEFAILAAVAVLRVVISLLLQWELKGSEKENLKKAE